ncbi:hypothetical protein, partial [Kineococcus arenarius]|uniref:hypothetical protein n=1 Tax=Kineococcus sp. SYSU DK007 TaxID=3383128 RepID=UPI003D7C77B2
MLLTRKAGAGRPWARKRLMVIAVVILVVTLIAGVITHRHFNRERQPSGTSASNPATPQSLESIFGARSVWKQDISTAPVAADSAPMVSRLAQEVASSYNGVAAF